MDIEVIEGGHVTSPKGFSAGAVAAGIKKREGALDLGLLVAFVVVPGVLIALSAVVRCLNRMLLHAVAWCTAGALANLGELLLTGAVADYIKAAGRVWSPGDAYLTVALGLLGLGVLKVIYDGSMRKPT